MEKIDWDVSQEEEDRVLLPAKDCRRFNSGLVAPKKIRETWRKSTIGNRQHDYAGIIAIDRLRDE